MRGGEKNFFSCLHRVAKRALSIEGRERQSSFKIDYREGKGSIARFAEHFPYVEKRTYLKRHVFHKDRIHA